MTSVDDRLAELGIVLPPVYSPLATVSAADVAITVGAEALGG